MFARAQCTYMFPALRSMQSFSPNRALFIDAPSLGPETRRDLCKTTKARTFRYDLKVKLFAFNFCIFPSLFEFVNVVQNVIPFLYFR